MSQQSVLEAQVDPMLLISRRAFPESQRLWAGPSTRLAAIAASCGWHGGDFSSEVGATALVARGSAYEDLVGEIVRVTRRRTTGDRSVLVYVLETADRQADISLQRRAFSALGHLANEELTVELDVVEPGGVFG